jgi:hypothetical protein
LSILIVLFALRLIPDIKRIKIFECTDCPWINPGNMREVIKIQKYVRKRILGNRLLRLIPQLMQIYYQYSAKGGYFHKKAMLGFLENIEKKRSDWIFTSEIHHTIYVIINIIHNNSIIHLTVIHLTMNRLAANHLTVN